jgi:site-specific DNA-methyltransferase (adenine-specific)
MDAINDQLPTERAASVEPNRLYQGDCLKEFARLETGSVNLVFADPPFNIGYDYDVYDDRSDADQYLDWTRKWGREVQRVLSPTGTFWLAIGDEYAAELKLIFQKELDFTCRSWVIWYYTFGVNCTKKFSRSHAHLFHFVKDARKFTFNAKDKAVRVPSARQLVYADIRGNPDGRLPDDTWILRPQDLPEGFQPDEDTWYFSRVCGTFKERAGWHGCQMPEQLLGRIIRVSSNPGELVLDPFAGSGTTLVTAKKLGRKWIGFELSPNYAARAQARLDGVREGGALDGPEDPQRSAPATPRRGDGKRPVLGPIVLAKRDKPEDIKRGVMEAFFAVRGEYPPDRIIADPELNQLFLEACHRLGLPGLQRDWNRHLLNLRKAGRFKGLPRAPRTRLTRQEIDRYGYACEIALQYLRDQGSTLDSVLCEPERAAVFDRYVASMIPEAVSPFRIRWLALHIRKRAKEVRQAGYEADARTLWPKRGQLLRSLDWDAVPQSSGLYWLQVLPSKRLYVGETLNLRQRLRLQLSASQFDFWDTNRLDLNIRIRELPETDEMILKGNQSWWIGHWNPVGNYSAFSAA